MNSWTFKTAGPIETMRLAEACAEAAVPSLLIAMRGAMGIGKTTFVRGLARGLGLGDVAHSPTFTLIAEHMGGRIPLYHVDLYRMGNVSDTDVHLLDEYLFGDGICVVEWAERMENALPVERLDIELQPDLAMEQDFLQRTVKVIASGSAAQSVLTRWVAIWQS